MTEKVSEFSFPGMNLFGQEQAQRLGALIQEISGFQPSTVREICEAQGIGWTPSGFPDTQGIARIEQGVKTRGLQ